MMMIGAPWYLRPFGVGPVLVGIDEGIPIDFIDGLIGSGSDTPSAYIKVVIKRQALLRGVRIDGGEYDTSISG